MSDGPALSPELRDYVEALGLQFEEHSGFTRMAGRVVAYLLVCDPPEATAAELAGALGASAGSISTTTRQLVRIGVVERLRRPGERVDRFRMRPEAWADSLRQVEHMRALRAALRRGLEALADAPPERRERLEELDALYAWFERRVPEIWDEYVEFRRRQKGDR